MGLNAADEIYTVNCTCHCEREAQKVELLEKIESHLNYMRRVADSLDYSRLCSMATFGSLPEREGVVEPKTEKVELKTAEIGGSCDMNCGECYYEGLPHEHTEVELKTPKS